MVWKRSWEQVARRRRCFASYADDEEEEEEEAEKEAEAESRVTE